MGPVLTVHSFTGERKLTGLKVFVSPPFTEGIYRKRRAGPERRFLDLVGGFLSAFVSQSLPVVSAFYFHAEKPLCVSTCPFAVTSCKIRESLGEFKPAGGRCVH